MLIKVALNGGRPHASSTPQEISEEIGLLTSLGAHTFHVHPRDSMHRESLLPHDVDPVVRAIRRRVPGISLGLTTGAWILPDVGARLEAISHWSELPDFASVNFDEEGCEAVAELLLSRGVGVEAGILDAASTLLFLRSGIPVVRVLVEVQEQTLDAALAAVDEIVETLGNHPAPRLLHGHGAVTWLLVDEAVRRGYDTRIGSEDVETLPDGRTATNLELYAEAARRSRA